MKRYNSRLADFVNHKQVCTLCKESKMSCALGRQWFGSAAEFFSGEFCRFCMGFCENVCFCGGVLMVDLWWRRGGAW